MRQNSEPMHVAETLQLKIPVWRNNCFLLLAKSSLVEDRVSFLCMLKSTMGGPKQDQGRSLKQKPKRRTD